MNAIHPSLRDQSIGHAIKLISSLLKVLIFLMQHGVFVVGFKGRKNDAGIDVVVIQVANSSYLRVLFTDAAWLKQRQEGALTIHTWFVVRNDIRIEWEDVCAHRH